MGGIVCLTASILLFHWHLQAFYGGQYLLHIVLFYPVNISFLFGILYLSKVLETYRFQFVINLSIGTLVIIGLHIIAISTINYLLEHMQHLDATICYEWYEALPISLVVISLFYPIILFVKCHLPCLIGRKST